MQLVLHECLLNGCMNEWLGGVELLIFTKQGEMKHRAGRQSLRQQKQKRKPGQRRWRGGGGWGGEAGGWLGNTEEAERRKEGRGQKGGKDRV